MIIRYEYKCGDCSHTYVEQRAKTEPQYFVKCNSCGIGNYEEISQKMAYAILGDNDFVADIVFANSVNEAEKLSDNKECLKIEDSRVGAGAFYERKWNVLVPVGLVYEPISKKIMTQEEKAAL